MIYQSWGVAEWGLETGDSHPRVSPRVTKPRTSCLMERILQGIPGMACQGWVLTPPGALGACGAAGFQGSTHTCPRPVSSSSQSLAGRSLQLPSLPYRSAASLTHSSASCQPLKGTGICLQAERGHRHFSQARDWAKQGPRGRSETPKAAPICLWGGALQERDQCGAASFCAVAGVTGMAS